MFKLNSRLLKAKVVKRPSATCKSPYVADIMLCDEEYNSETIFMAHAPSLGCSGMVARDKYVYVIKNENMKKDAKCEYTIYIAHDENDNIVGVHPKVAEKLIHSTLHNNIMFSLKNLNSITPEVKIDDSRFDFVVYDKNNIKTIIEVKNVPLVHSNVVSYFPEGYRKKKGEPVSPRAVKHIKSLAQLKRDNGNNIRCIMFYVIQRNDSMIFEPSDTDPIYKEAFYEAVDAGVEIYPCKYVWDIKNATCNFKSLITYKVK